MKECEVTASDVINDTVGVWDGKERELILAFPPGRPNPTHVHTKVMTKWEEKLGEWAVPGAIRDPHLLYFYLWMIASTS